MKSIWYYESPVGTIGITEEDDAISHVFYKNDSSMPGYSMKETSLIKKAATQLSEYFVGKRKEFDLPLLLQGTEFQQSVWKSLKAIPAGQTVSYKDIAVQVGHPKAYRAVGMANNKNPIVIVVPCHRVIGMDGGMVGYAGGLSIKQFLLELEKQYY